MQIPQNPILYIIPCLILISSWNSGCSKKETADPSVQSAPEIKDKTPETQQENQSNPEVAQPVHNDNQALQSAPQSDSDPNDNKSHQSAPEKSDKHQEETDKPNLAPKRILSFTNHDNDKVKWKTLEKKYPVAELKSKSDTSMLELSKKLDKNFYSTLKQNPEEPACKIQQILEGYSGNAGFEARLVTCIHTDEHGETNTSKYCNSENEEEGTAKDIYIGIRAKDENIIRYYLYDTVPDNCTREDYWSTSYSYNLEDVYISDFMNSWSAHVIIGISSNFNDCDYDRAEDGLDCAHDNTYIYMKDHLVFVDHKFRLIGNYIEYKLLKKTKASCSTGCPDFLNSEIYTYSFTLNDDKWEYVQESGSVKIDSFSSEEEVEKMNEYAENNEWDKITDPKVLPELEPYLKYTQNNPLMDIQDLEKFYTTGKSTKKQGTLDGNRFNLGKKFDEDEIKRFNEMGWFHIQ